MKKLISILAIFSAIFLLLVLTRPDENDYKKWVKKKYSTENIKTKSDNILDKYGEIGLAKAMQIQLLNSYQYENHIISSEIIAWSNLKKRKFIGVLGTWIQVPVKEVSNKRLSLLFLLFSCREKHIIQYQSITR